MTTTLHQLLEAARNRTPVVLHTVGSDSPLGAMPLWATGGGRHVLAVTWATSGDATTYRLQPLAADGWTVHQVGTTVPPVDLAAAVTASANGTRAVIEAMALIERFKLEADLGYSKPGEAPKRRRVRRVVNRGNRIVCEDCDANDARSFNYDRTAYVLLQPPTPAPVWNGAEYVDGADHAV